MLIAGLNSLKQPPGGSPPPGCYRIRRGLLLGIALFLLVPVLSATPALAQGQTVAGRVLNARTREPLSDAQIQILGTERGVLSQTDGRFMLMDVSGDQVTLSVTLLGYRSLDQTVRVGDRDVVLTLEPTAVQLDELVVTGTPGAQRVRALGNSVGRVQAAELLEVTAPTDVRQLIGARVAGVNLAAGEGMIGGGGAIAIRGVGSLSLSSTPLIYVDGIRVDNDVSDTGVGDNYGNGANRLDDLNPEDIESVEIIKGPAATTLYGTEASNGVIQIITKRGRTQEAEWDFRMDQGVTYLPSPETRYPLVWGRVDGQLTSLNIVQNDIDQGYGSPFRTGHLQSYGASVRGGTDRVQYFLSGDFGHREGIVTYNWQQKLNLRSNLSFVLGEQLDLQFNLGTVRMETETPGSQPPTTGILWGTPELLDTRYRGYLTNPPEEFEKLENVENYDRLTYSVQLRHHPREWLNQRFIVGGDYGFRRGSEYFPRTAEQPGPWGSTSQGRKNVGDTRNVLNTVDYTATAGLELTSTIRSETSVGAQFIRRQAEESRAYGDIFPVPGLSTVSATALRSAREDFVEERTVGAFVQQQFSYGNRFFFTAGVRGDDHSAFGKNFDFVLYPKFMGSWVLSEEAFLQGVEFLNTLKLRGAWGRAGQQPSTFAAVRLYSPSTGRNAAPTVTPSNIGNPDLEPEVGEEIEIGFDASFFEDRVGVEFTYYDQTTKKALVQAPVKPSTGFPGSQSLNLGEISNSGLEVSVNATPVRRENLSWTLALALGTNSNEIVSLGGATIPPGTSTAEIEGFPISSIFLQKVVSAEYDANGNLINVLCDGGRGPSGMDSGGDPVPCSQAPRVFWGFPVPSWQGSLSTTLTLWRDLRLYALADFQGGNTYVNGDVAATHTLFSNSRCANEIPICDPILAAYNQTGGWRQAGIMPAGFAKLRTLSASYSLPNSLVTRIGGSRATLTLAVQNVAMLWLAQDQQWGHKVIDPENIKEASMLDSYNQEGWPIPTTIQTSLRINF